jgi:hypothetical protein
MREEVGRGRERSHLMMMLLQLFLVGIVSFKDFQTEIMRLFLGMENSPGLSVERG